MNMHVNLTPTQQAAIERHQNFRASIAARAVELAHRKANAALEALRVVALEAPLIHTPSIQTVAPGPNWFVVLTSDPKPRDYPSILQIQKAVAAHFKVTVTDLISKRRTADIVLPRQIAFYLCKQLTPQSYPQIGRRFGGKDHTTALHSVQKIGRLLDIDPALSELVSGLIQKIGAAA